MQDHRVWILAAAVAIGGTLLVGCESNSGAGKTEGDETTNPQSLSNQPSNQPDNSVITPEMRRFDAGIGDTATGAGGGQANQ